MKQELITLSALKEEGIKVLCSMLEESLNCMYPYGYEDDTLQFEDIKEDVWYEHYKREQRIWDIQKELLIALREVSQ